jgi:multiple sugar transport system permease protein
MDKSIPVAAKGGLGGLARLRRDLTHPRTRWAYIFVLPAVLWFVGVRLYPAADMLFNSLHLWRGMGTGKQFIGLRNYGFILTDSAFLVAIKNTFLYTLLFVPFSVFAGLFLGFLFSRDFPLKDLFKAVYFLPSVTSMVAVSVMWKLLYQPLFGLLNEALKLVAIPPQDWLHSTKQVIPSVALMGVWWRAGFNMIIFLSGLTAIPTAYFESATIDGASTWKVFWRITFPLLMPTTVAALMMTTIAGLQTFTQIYVMTQGGPGDSSRTVVYHIYESAMEFNWLGRASAMAIVLLAIVMLITVLQWTLLQRKAMRGYE